MTRLIAIFAVLAFGQFAAAQEPDFSALKDRLASYVADGDLPGGVVLVRQGNKTLLSHAFGYRDVEAADPMDLGDQFRIASQTKLIVSVGIMMLIEEGALTLETPLASIFPEWGEVQVATEDGLAPLDRPIVIQDLLSHSSGIGYGFTDAWADTGLTAWYFAGSARPMREAVRQMATIPLNHQPGASWTYGYNTDILGALIMELTDQSLSAFLEERIFWPLSMRDTQFFLSPDEAGNLAVVYSRSDDLTLVRAPNPGGPVGQGHYVEGPQLVESGGAGLITSAEDYVTLLDMLRAGGIHDGQRLLNAETVALMAEPVVHGAAPPWHPVDTLSFGLGHEVSIGRLGGRPSGSLGWGGAYHTVYWIDPVNDLSVVYLTQVFPAGGLDDQAIVEQMIYEALK